MRHADMLCTYVRTVVRRGATRYLMPVLVSYTMVSLLIKRDDSKKNGKNSAKIPKSERTNLSIESDYFDSNFWLIRTYIIIAPNYNAVNLTTFIFKQQFLRIKTSKIGAGIPLICPPSAFDYSIALIVLGSVMAWARRVHL